MLKSLIEFICPLHLCLPHANDMATIAFRDHLALRPVHVWRRGRHPSDRGRADIHVILTGHRVLYLHLELVLLSEHLLVDLTKCLRIHLQRLAAWSRAQHVHVCLLPLVGSLHGAERARVVGLLVKQLVVHHFVRPRRVIAVLIVVLQVHEERRRAKITLLRRIVLAAHSAEAAARINSVVRVVARLDGDSPVQRLLNTIITTEAGSLAGHHVVANVAFLRF